MGGTDESIIFVHFLSFFFVLDKIQETASVSHQERHS